MQQHPGLTDDGSTEVLSFLAIYNGQDGSGARETMGYGVSWTSDVVVNLDDIGNLVSLGAAGARRGTEE